MSSRRTLPEHEERARRLAGLTLADLRTARRFVRGEHIRGLLGQRLAEADAQLRAASPSQPPPASTAA